MVPFSYGSNFQQILVQKRAEGGWRERGRKAGRKEGRKLSVTLWLFAV
jgi:hypothetical protein